VLGGFEQVNGDDFQVSGAVLDWSGYGLDDGTLAPGDKIILKYFA
jgi:hypothetical protein